MWGLVDSRNYEFDLLAPAPEAAAAVPRLHMMSLLEDVNKRNDKRQSNHLDNKDSLTSHGHKADAAGRDVEARSAFST